MGIRYCHSSIQPKVEGWSVLFKTIPLHDVPPDFHECLSIHKIQVVSIGIAGALSPPPHPQPPHSYRPFFGLPLLDTISLPIHLHCTFILSDDRRSIRYDEKGRGNVESRFNKWLLTEKVPLIYLQFLAGWNNTHPMKECPWWPREIGTDTISNTVATGMEAIFPISNQLVCDTYSGTRIAPAKVHFLQPSCPRGLLQKLRPNDLAIIPPGFSSPPLRGVDSDYLTTILQQKAASIILMYKEGRITVDNVVPVARFIKLSSFPDSLGLPLLPLADGTLASISAGHTTFYCPPRQHKTPWLPFPPHHFLDPKAAKEHNVYDLLRVQKLDKTAISRLIASQIPEQDTFSPSPSQELWLEELWDLLDTTPEVDIGHLAFKCLPLIPTYNPGTPTRISFQKLTGSEVLFVKHHRDVPLDACVLLGMTVIKAKDCGRKLKEAIESHKQWPSEIHHAVINFFTDFTFLRRFQGLDRELHSEFSRWLRDQLVGSYRSLNSAKKVTVQCLPLWETAQVGSRPTRFVSANEAVVIPEGISPDAVRTWARGTTELTPTNDLLSLMKKPDTPPTFYASHLTFPSVMNPPTPGYKTLLQAVLRSPDRRLSILVPNATGSMLQSNELYLSSNTTFTNAFASRRGAFLHPNLRDLERRLCNWGLISEITTSSFRACAEAIHQDVGRADIRGRALVVFRTYNTQMPPKLLGDNYSQAVLQNLCFIPRRLGSTRYGSIPTDRFHALPDIVSPSEILSPDFVRVAWTQRAMCLEEPSTTLLLVNSSVWKPETSEVVCSILFIPSFTSHSPFQIEHLRVLSTEIAPNLGYHAELIEDLKATYSWLADRESGAERLRDYNEERLFLNTDDPVREWSWNSASELLFDERDSSNPRRVRNFLKNYSGLLRAAGVKEINHVSIPDNLMREDSHETQLTRLRNKFNSMREADRLTDVTFIARDGTEFPAHRVFLAAQSRHFETCFASGSWRESRDLEEQVEIPVDHGQECLQAVLGSLPRSLNSI